MFGGDESEVAHDFFGFGIGLMMWENNLLDIFTLLAYEEMVTADFFLGLAGDKSSFGYYFVDEVKRFEYVEDAVDGDGFELVLIIEFFFDVVGGEGLFCSGDDIEH